MATPNYNNHPLPTPPQQQQPQQGQRQYQQYGAYQPQQPQPQQQSQSSPAPVQSNRKSRGFSLHKSDKSHKSQKSTDSSHHHITETSAEKESKRLHSKADPTLAISEAEPSAVAQMTGGDRVLKPLSSLQHKDIHGNPIVDPDRSNPTRNRWERPLETIRNFEAAIDGGYDRKSMLRADTDSMANGNRRSSYYANGSNTPRFPQESYYNGRPQSTMYESRQPGYYDGYDGGRNRNSRMQSEPQLTRPRNVYPVPNNHRSYETVASGSGSGSYGEPAGYQTDPTSSENSSIERRSPPKRQEPINDYGISFGQDIAYQPPPPNFGVSMAPHVTESAAPPPPRKDVGSGSTLRKNPRAAGPSESAEISTPTSEKRKSWFTRRFSKNS